MQHAGFLSVLLYPPVSALLFLGLSRITLSAVDAETGIPKDGEPQAVVSEAGAIAPLFTAEVQRWGTQIVDWAVEHDLDPNLVATVMQIESCGDPGAVSPAGARGLFQVMPYHFVEGEDPHDPSINALRGLSYLRLSLDSFEGDAAMAMAGYNGGINGASRPQSEWAQETIGYMYWGANIYADASAARESSPVLEEWMSSGGASLCAQAAGRLAAQP